MKKLVVVMALVLSACASPSPVAGSFRECLLMGGSPSYITGEGITKFECHRT